MLNKLGNINLFKTLFYNIRLFKTYRPKFLVGKRTIVMIKNNSKINIKHRFELGTIYSKKQKTLLNIGENALLEIGSCNFGNGGRLSISPNANLKIGNNVFVNENTRIWATKKIEIGDDCIISWNVNIIDGDIHTIYENDIKKEQSKEIKINDRVWVGFNASILKGVTVGEGSIIASNTVVTKDVPPYSLVAGNPAKVVKSNVKWER